MAKKSQPVIPTPRRRRWWWPVLLAASLLALGFFGWQAYQRQAITAAHVPPRPELAAFPPEFPDKILEAEQAAAGYWHAAAGLRSLSRLYHANGFYVEALQCYDGLQLLEPNEARWPHLTASILAESGRLDEALPPRMRAVALDPNYLPARLRLGDVYLKANRTAEAAKVYAEVLNRNAENAYALLGIARCAIVGGDWQKARELLEQTVRLHPNFYGGSTLLVTVLEHFTEQARADELRASLGKQEFVDLTDPWIESLAEDCYDPYRLSVLAAMANSSGDEARARQMLQRVVVLAPENGSYRRQLGQALSQAGDLAAARVQFEKAVVLSPIDADAWLLLFQTLKSLGQMESAQNTLATGLANCPLSPSLHLERARLLNSAGRLQEAIAEFRESYRLRPSETAPLVELAGALFATNQADEALAVLGEGLKKQPEHPMILATLTLYAISVGDEARARSWWSHVRRQPRTPPQLVDTIRQAYQRQFGRPLN